MNSLQQLNNFGTTEIEFTDPRPAGVLFDRTSPTNQEVQTTQGGTHNIPIGINITEIINYNVSLPTYTIDVSGRAGATVSWASLPAGITLTTPSTGVYVLSGMKSKSQWDLIKSPTVTSPMGFDNNYWQYTATINYNTIEIRSWTIGVYVGTVTVLTSPSNSTYTQNSTNNITGYPQISFPIGSIIWTVTLTPDKLEGLDELKLSSTPSGVTVDFNATTKVLTLSGLAIDVNAALALVQAVTEPNYYWTWKITYYASNSSNGANGTRTQSLVNVQTTILSPTRADETYSINTTADITNGPLLSDSGTDSPYTLQIYAYDNAAAFEINKELNYLQPFFNDAAGATISLPSSSLRYMISGDGLWLVVGDSFYNLPSTGAGRVLIYNRSSIYSRIWTLVKTLSIGLANVQFGWSVAINYDGSVIAAGILRNIGTDNVYIYRRGSTLTDWPLEGSIAGINNQFGTVIRFNDIGDIVMISNPQESEPAPGIFAGSLRFYQKRSTGWVEIYQYLSGTDAATPSGIGAGQISEFREHHSDSTYRYFLVVNRYSTGTVQYNIFRLNKSNTVPAESLGTISPFQLPAFDQINSLSLAAAGSSQYLAIGGGATKVYVYMMPGVQSTFSLQQEINVGVSGNHQVDINAAANSLIVMPNTGNDRFVYTRSGTSWSLSDTVTTSGIFSALLSSDDIHSTVIYSLLTPTGLSIHDRIPEITSSSWDPVNKIYTAIDSSKDDINVLIDNINFTPNSGYQDNFELIYKIISNSGVIGYRNQYVNRI